MFRQSILRTARSTIPLKQAYTRKATIPVVRCASLFTASVGLGVCPKRRKTQSNPESGEDAYFINLSPSTASKIWAGVFDGVGGWADSGVDPSVFSRGLAKHCDAATDQTPDASPSDILMAGYEALQKDKSVKMGSSTACVASVGLNDGELRVANLGDSGYLIVNLAGEVVFTSKPQTYFFNAPYQLAKMPDSMRSPGSLENKPTDANATTHNLRTDEFVILATDGFFDNIYPHDAAKAAASIARQGKPSKQEVVNEIAKSLTDSAREAGRSRKNGPFAEEARAHRLRYDGGKEDDICIVVIALDADIAAKSKL